MWWWVDTHVISPPYKPKHIFHKYLPISLSLSLLTIKIHIMIHIFYMSPLTSNKYTDISLSKLCLLPSCLLLQSFNAATKCITPNPLLDFPDLLIHFSFFSHLSIVFFLINNFNLSK
ncbi:hypothetical protein ACOSQ2_006038 [Xanthoceras sorbifolium]